MWDGEWGKFVFLSFSRFLLSRDRRKLFPSSLSLSKIHVLLIVLAEDTIIGSYYYRFGRNSFCPFLLTTLSPTVRIEHLFSFSRTSCTCSLFASQSACTFPLVPVCVPVLSCSVLSCSVLSLSHASVKGVEECSWKTFNFAVLFIFFSCLTSNTHLVSSLCRFLLFPCSVLQYMERKLRERLYLYYVAFEEKCHGNTFFCLFS